MVEEQKGQSGSNKVFREENDERDEIRGRKGLDVGWYPGLYSKCNRKSLNIVLFCCIYTRNITDLFLKGYSSCFKENGLEEGGKKEKQEDQSEDCQSSPAKGNSS